MTKASFSENKNSPPLASEGLERSSPHTHAPTLDKVISVRYSRRSWLKSALAMSTIASVGGLSGGLPRAAKAAYDRFPFTEIERGVDTHHHVAPGYNADILLRWGDPITANAPVFDPTQQSPASQEMQFGYNNDFVGYLPLPFGSDNSGHGLLFINHEYVNTDLMIPGLGVQHPYFGGDWSGVTQDIVDIEMSAHGISIVEIKKHRDRWSVITGSRYARRISPRTTTMSLSGPAAGHPRLKTSADITGTQVIGTLNNCSGGLTPWGTVLSGEENFRGYFWSERSKSTDKRQRRYGIPGKWYLWGRFYQRFDIDIEPNESHRFGYIVEIDPYDPQSKPIKRTALGRFAHEGANVIVNKDAHVVVYMGDDAYFEYLYKFVSHHRFDANHPSANKNILDDGVLYVAKFKDDGTLSWLPLVFGKGPLTPENGFASQADVLIDARLAADTLGATPMDRPEDVESNPITGKVYVMLTKNHKRKPEQVDGANPRANNHFGHIIELIPRDGNHAALDASWEILLQAGDPNLPEIQARYHPDITDNGWFATPDNCAIDHQGRLWITTDQGRNWGKTGTADGLYAVETEGEGRGLSRLFFRAPVGAELCGPMFTPDDKTLFLSVQHPGADGVKDFKGFEKPSTYEEPATRWPDFNPSLPVRPSVVVITKKDGGRIGG